MSKKQTTRKNVGANFTLDRCMGMLDLLVEWDAGVSIVMVLRENEGITNRNHLGFKPIFSKYLG